jgi:hypothetical protein
VVLQRCCYRDGVAALLLRGVAVQILFFLFFCFYSTTSREKRRARKRKMSKIQNLFPGSIG